MQELLRDTPSASLTYTIEFLSDDGVLVRLNGMLFEGQIQPIVGTDFFLRTENGDSHTPLATATRRIVLKQFVCPLPP